MSKFICLECGTILEPIKGVKILECKVCNENLNIQSLYTFEEGLGLKQSQIKKCYSGTLETEHGYLIMLDKKLVFIQTGEFLKNKPEITLEIPYESLTIATKIEDSRIELFDSDGNQHSFKPHAQSLKRFENEVKTNLL